ncbi:glycosyl hydrolase family 28 [Mucilaginibacter frigoritolerans]|uniref:Glycosyl hydrolase family 28 n=2 Tax=Mucilaginibacter frigoritolerans TaxID=652788 RepID=A0A562TLH3_9SPHI|nr:glycosyl hydrolase family 28 [Mucilaginibacter frigoritolerans]
MKYAGIILLFSLMLSSDLFAQKNYLITTFGAKPDGITNNAVAIQKAIDAASLNGGGKVIVPAGDFVTGVIRFKSGVEISLEQNARLIATPRRLDYGLQKASALIIADHVSHIAITGKGTIDGNAANLLVDIYRMLNNGTLEDKEWKTYNEWHQLRPAEKNRPHIIDFTACDHITIKNITIKNGLCWIQDYSGCSHMVIDSITVESNTFLNNDGIDLDDCKDVKLTNSSFNVADDGICLKSYNANSCCDNIYIANCRIRSSASAFKLGTASHGGFKHITVKNIQVYDTFRSAIALETVDGGFLQDINISNIVAKNTGNAIFIRRGQRNPKAAPGVLKGITINNVKAEIPAGKPDTDYEMAGPAEPYPHHVFPASITGIPGYPVVGITLNHIEISYEGSSVPELKEYNPDEMDKIPEKISGYPEFSMFGELPAWGLYMRHAESVVLKDIKLSYLKSDKRIACVFDDINMLSLNNFKIAKTENYPVILFRNVKGKVLKDLQLPDGSKAAIQVK